LITHQHTFEGLVVDSAVAEFASNDFLDVAAGFAAVGSQAIEVS